MVSGRTRTAEQRAAGAETREDTGMGTVAAAALGVYVHGLAGEAAEKHFGVHGVLAGEIADCLPEVYRDGI